MDDVIRIRILTKCFGRYDQQSVEHALNYCVRCRVMKSCVQKAWGWREKRKKRDPALFRERELIGVAPSWRPGRSVGQAGSSTGEVTAGSATEEGQ